MPLYALGLMGVTRRMRVFDDPSLQIYFIVAAIGAAMIMVGILAFLIQIFVSIKNREQLRDFTGDPWNGRTLEWSTSSPPPAYNFAFTPLVHDRDAWWDMKTGGYTRPTEGFNDIHMPKNTGAGIILAGLSMVCGFALIWYMWWLAAVSFAALVIGAIVHTFNYNRDYHLEAKVVAKTEAARTKLLAKIAKQGA
jgi:cytochrome o ubiquinol oxidase subunit 1